MKQVVDVFWTGGWDSTFRLVELLTQTDATVRPHYIRDPERVSADLEIRTMMELRRLLVAQVPGAEDRFLPLIVTDVQDIPPDQGIADALGQLRRQAHLGLQYDFLARYARLVARRPMELCIEYNRNGNVGRLIVDRLIGDTDAPHRRYRLSDRGDAISGLFRWFRFPISDRDMHQMREQARRWGVEAILLKTWFCHQPLLGRYPCGTCRPCVYVMNKHQTWRMGFPGRLRFLAIERPKRLVPGSAKAWLRQRAGRHIRRVLRA